MIKWVGSPNFDTNRKPIDRIIIHWIVGTLASADAQFQKTDPGTSAHYGIENDNIHQYVREDNVAYHAGVYTMNQRSIGIEHSATPDRPASDATYNASGNLIREICQRHNIPIDRSHIIKHSEVKATQCPGTMDIDRLLQIAKGASAVSETFEIDKKLFEQLVGKSTKYDEFVSAGFNSAQDAKNAIEKLINEKNSIDHNRELLQRQLTDLEEQFANYKNTHASTPTTGFQNGKVERIRPLVFNGWITYLRSRGAIQSIINE